MSNPSMQKASYIKYRQMLSHANIKSYIDQFGRPYTDCSECNKKDCKIKNTIPGCMQGETRADILDKIKR